MPCATFGGSRAAALIWIMPFWHPLRMTLSLQHQRFAEPMYNALSSVIGGGRGAHASGRNTSPCSMWSLTSPRADRISGSSKILFGQPEKTFSTVSGNSGLILAPIADAGVSAAVRSTAHRPAVAGFQKRETQSDRGIDVAVLEEAEGPTRHAPG